MEHGPSGTGTQAAHSRAAPRWVAEALSVLYMAAIGAAAAHPGLAMLMIPELGALTHDVLTGPGASGLASRCGWWSRRSPTAVVGTMATRRFPYHVLTILLVVCISLGIIRLLRSEIAPAISAGVLPLVLGVQSWLYPPSIAAGVLGLVAMQLAMRRKSAAPVRPEAKAQDVDDVLESAPGGGMWLGALLMFVVLAGLAAQLPGLRFILFPPLIVVAGSD